MPPETLEEEIPLADAGREIVTWRPLPREERDAWENLSPRNKETCDALLPRLHRGLGHSDIRGVVNSFRQPKVYPTILAAAKLMKCGACQASARFSLRPVVSGRLAEPGAVPQEDKVCWKHPAREIHRKGTLSVDIASRVTVVRIWKTSLRAESLENVSSVEAKTKVQECWFKCYGRPMVVMADPECYDTSCEDVFHRCTEAHNELSHPCNCCWETTTWIATEEELGEISTSLTSDGR